MAVIYCFSATGNSLYVAKQIGEAIGGQVLPMKDGHVSCSDEVIGFVFPTYYWGLPYQVERFISELTITSQNPYIFAVATYGGAVRGILGAVEKLLIQKGHHLSYSKKLKAVENYIPSYKVNDTQQMENKVNAQLNSIIDAVKNQQIIKPQAYTFINKIAYTFFPAKEKNCDQYFTVSNKCNHCETCSKVCPVENIIAKKTEIQFQHHCEHCLACIHACPQVAIEWKKGTVGKERFLNRHISLKELMLFNSGTSMDVKE